MALVMDREEEVEETSLWRRLYHQATAAVAYAVADGGGTPASSGEKKKDCNTCSKEATKIKKVRARRKKQ